MTLTDLSQLTCERCKFSCTFACFACQYFANLHCNTLHALQFALQLHTLQILRSRNAQFACAATPARFANRLTIVCNLLANLACACACLLLLHTSASAACICNCNTCKLKVCKSACVHICFIAHLICNCACACVHAAAYIYACSSCAHACKLCNINCFAIAKLPCACAQLQLQYT